MQSKYLKRLEEGAKHSPAELNVDPAGLDDSNVMYWAMLATKYKEDYKKMTFPCYVQLKMNGIRMISYLNKPSSVITYSRDLKEIPGIPTIKQALLYPLRELFNEDSEKSIRIDGEIFGFDVPLNLLSGWARNPAINNSTTIASGRVGYFIFDMFDPSNLAMTFEERLEYLDSVRGLADSKTEVKSFKFNIDAATRLASNEYKRALEHFNNAKGSIEAKGKRTEEQEFLKDEYPFDNFAEWAATIN